MSPGLLTADVEAGGGVQPRQRRLVERAAEPGEQVGGAAPAAEHRDVPGRTGQGGLEQRLGIGGVVVAQHQCVTLVQGMRSQPSGR